MNNNISGWGKYRVDEIFDFLKTYPVSRDNLQNETVNTTGIGNIHYGDIHTNFANAKIDLERVLVPMIKDRSFISDSEAILKNGDILMVDASEDYEGVGLTTTIHNIGNKEVVGGLHTFVLRDNKKLTTEYFRQYIFRNPTIRNSLQKIANGVSVYGISKKSLSKLPINIPSLAEQNRIVAVLETWDKAIEKLKKKIEIKKKAKVGLMQELLGGKLRAKSFNSRWDTVEVGSLGSNYSGLTGKNGEDFGSGKPYIPYMNVYQNSKIDPNFLSLVKISEDEVQNVAQYGDIFFTTSSETPEEVGISSVLLDPHVGELYLNSFCFGFRLHNFDRLIPEFAEHYFRSTSFRKSMFRIAQGASRFNLSKKYFMQVKIKVPSDLNEQKIIADILTQSDLEIGKLSEKLQLLQDQKKYLLNNLITGNIRTPENLLTN